MGCADIAYIGAMATNDHLGSTCPQCQLTYDTEDAGDRQYHADLHHRREEYGQVRGYAAFLKRDYEHLKSHGRNLYRAATTIEAKVHAAGFVARARYEWEVNRVLGEGPVSELPAMREFVLRYPWEEEFGLEIADKLRSYWKGQPPDFLPALPLPPREPGQLVFYTWPTPADGPAVPLSRG
jgi:hypothetical protein